MFSMFAMVLVVFTCSEREKESEEGIVDRGKGGRDRGTEGKDRGRGRERELIYLK